MIKYFVYLSFLACSNAQGQLVEPHVNSSCAVLIETINDSTYSSGFIVADSSYLYLVTSRHSFIGLRKTPYYADFFLTSNEFNVLTYNEDAPYKEPLSFDIKNLISIYYQGNLKFDSVHDVVVIRLGHLNNQRSKFLYLFPVNRRSKSNVMPAYVELKKFIQFDSTFVGQQVCTVGFPKSLGLEENDQYDFNHPLLRKGIVAGLDSIKGNVVIDCPCYKGNSGGPVFQLIKYQLNGSEGTTYNLLGLVSEFIPYRERKYDSSLNVKDTFVWNSGYSVVTPADYIKRLIGLFKL